MFQTKSKPEFTTTSELCPVCVCVAVHYFVTSVSYAESYFFLYRMFTECSGPLKPLLLTQCLSCSDRVVAGQCQSVVIGENTESLYTMRSSCSPDIHDSGVSSHSYYTKHSAVESPYHLPIPDFIEINKQQAWEHVDHPISMAWSR